MAGWALLSAGCAGMLDSSPGEFRDDRASVPPGVDPRNADARPARRLVRVGDPVPRLVWQDQNGVDVTTVELAAGGDALLVFHPGARTGAARPVHEFVRRRRDQIESHGCEILLVVPDEPATNARVAAEEQLRVAILHDPAAWSARAFGLADSSEGVESVWSVLLGREGRVLAVKNGVFEMPELLTALMVRPEGERRSIFERFP